MNKRCFVRFCAITLAISLILAGCDLSGDDTPELTGTVTIDKTSPKVGDILTATYSGNGTGAATWQWFRGDTLISGAVANTYTVVTADVGKSLKAQVSYKDQEGVVASQATAATAAAVVEMPALTGTVIIDNTSPKVGDRLTATYEGNGTGDITWEWFRDNDVIRKSTNYNDINRYTVDGADADAVIRVRVSTDEQSGSVTSAPTEAVVDNRLTLTGTVSLSNNAPRVGDTITATYSGNGTGAAAWQWLRGSNLISEATGNTYTPVTADAGSSLKARVSYEGQKGSISSAATAAVIAASGGNTGGDNPGSDNPGSDNPGSYNPGGSIIAVTGISGIPSSGTVGTLTLNGVVTPGNATNQTITWSIKEAGTTGATISGSAINIKATGTVVVTATIMNGTAAGTNYTRDFSITISLPVSSIFTVSNAAEWNSAITSISGGGSNKAYEIIVIADFIWNDPDRYTFGNVTGIEVTISGDRKVTLNGSGKLLRINTNQNVIMRDLDLVGNSSNYSALVSVFGGGFTMQGSASVSGNNGREDSGGVNVIYSTFIMEDYALVSGNRTNRVGGGVYVSTNSTFIMRDNASVSGNIATEQGGGVYIGGDTFTMQGNASVSGNTAKDGGGVYASYSKFTMESNAILSGNTATNDGGGVNADGGNIIMRNNASVSGNTAANDGGGVYVGLHSVFHFADGIVYGSDASNTTLRNTSGAANPKGAALYVYPDGRGYAERGTFSVAGGEWISKGRLENSNNTYRVENGELITGDNGNSGNTFVAVDSITGVPTAGNVRRSLTLTGTVAPSNATNQTITWSVLNTGTTGATISGSTLSATATGTVTVRATIANGTAVGMNYTQDFTIPITILATTHTINSADDWAEFVTSIRMSSSNMGPGGSHNEYTVNINTDFSTDYGLAVTWDYISIFIKGNHTIAYTGTTEFLLIDDDTFQINVVMEDLNVEIKTPNNYFSAILVSGNDNAFTMKGSASLKGTTGSVSGVIVRSGGTFTMQDSAKVTDNTADTGGGVLVGANGTFYMKGNAKVTDNTASTGGGVLVVNSGTFIMQDNASVSNNTAESGGAGVSSTGTFIMKDYASITGNSSGQWGGGAQIPGGTFTMYDNASVSDNTSCRGGGVDLSGGTFIMQGGTILGNKTFDIAWIENPNSGGGVFIYSTFRIVNGTIYGSTAAVESNRNTAGDGAAIYKYGNSTAEYGTFSGPGGAWVGKGSLETTINTITVESGDLMQ